MFKVYPQLAVLTVLVLMSCGSTGTDGMDYSQSSIMNSTYILQDGTVVRLTDQTSAGRGVISSEGFFAGSESNLIILSEDAQDTKKIIQSATNWTNQGGTTLENNLYTAELTAYSADGKPIYVLITGQCLSSDCENVTNSVMVHDGNYSLMAGGNPVNQFPNGTFVYTGPATLTNNQSTAEDGTFSLTANFNNLTGQVVGTTPTYFFSGKNLVINPTTGRFDDVTGIIGENNGSSEVATVSGYFAGSNAAGVSGAVYGDLNKTAYLTGMFYGKSSSLINEIQQASDAVNDTQTSCRQVTTSNSLEEACGSIVNTPGFKLQDYYGTSRLPYCEWVSYETVCD